MFSICGTVFDPELLKRYEADEPRYIIGIDPYDKDSQAYCLTKYSKGGMIDIVLAKNMKIKEEFDQEVENLAKYFNAKVIK